MIASGLVSQKSAYVKGGKQHRKVYFPTPKGRAEADGLIRSLFNEFARAVGKDVGPKVGIVKFGRMFGSMQASSCDDPLTKSNISRIDRKSTRLNSSHITISYA